MSLNPDIVYESALMANISYEDLIKLAQIYSVGKDITNHICNLIEKEVIMNQSNFLDKFHNGNSKEYSNEDGTFIYPLKPEEMESDSYAYKVILDCLRDPEKSDEYIGPGYDYDKVIENSKTLKTITEQKKINANLIKPLSEEDKSKMSSFEKMRMVLNEYEPCDEIKLMIISHIEQRNGGLSEKMKENKEIIVKKIKSFEAKFELAEKEAKVQSRVNKSWNKISDELCSFFLTSDNVDLNKEDKEKFENGWCHTNQYGELSQVRATFENGHIVLNDGKSEVDRLSLYVRKSNSTIPPTLHISFRGTEGDHLKEYVKHDYRNMYSHYSKMKPIINKIIEQELKKHKDIYGDTPLTINWSGHSLGAACASIALNEHKDNFEIKNTGAFFGMPEIINTTTQAILEVGVGVEEYLLRIASCPMFKARKFAKLGVESFVSKNKNMLNVVDDRAISINQEGDIITSSRRLRENVKGQLTYPTINIIKDKNIYSIDHHSSVDYALITKNMLDSFALHNHINAIKANSFEKNNIQEYYVGNVEKMVEDSSKKTVLDRLSNLRNYKTQPPSNKNRI